MYLWLYCYKRCFGFFVVTIILPDVSLVLSCGFDWIGDLKFVVRFLYCRIGIGFKYWMGEFDILQRVGLVEDCRSTTYVII